MAGTTRLVRVFVASPADVQPEREAVKHVIDDINLMQGQSTEARLEYVGWDRNTRPGFGRYPQEVINTQIGDDYDVFLGIMWTRFGTETPAAGSGTEEEFDLAYSRLRHARTLPKILLYFKDKGPNEIGAIDLVQLKKVIEFRDRVRGLGG